MYIRRGTATLVALIVLGMTGQALALDGYQDRRGFFTRVGVGGTANKVCHTECGDRHLGLALRLRAGVGLNQHFTGDFGVHLTSSKGEATNALFGDSERSISGIFLGANYYVGNGLYGRLSLGLSQLEETATLLGGSVVAIDTKLAVEETGLAYGAEMGFELFANADWAVAISADIELHQYDDFDAQLFTLAITGTHY
jgi:hypothetical protein